MKKITGIGDIAMSERLDWALETLRAVLRDDKPAIDSGNPDQKFLYDRMTRVYASFFVPEILEIKNQSLSTECNQCVIQLSEAVFFQ